jgi:RND family efflux transporter MFP subunit
VEARKPEPVASLTDEQLAQRIGAGDAEARQAQIEGLWSAFAAPANEPVFFVTWLGILVSQIPETQAALVMVPGDDGQSVAPIAVWPDPQVDLSYLRVVAEEALSSRQGVVRHVGANAETAKHAAVHIAYPVDAEGDLGAVILLHVNAGSDADLKSTLRTIHWASGWLGGRMWRRRATLDTLRLKSAAATLDLVAVASEHLRLDAALIAVVNAVVGKIACDRVSIGLVSDGRKIGGRVKLATMSHAAWFRPNTSLTDDLENAMEEALDQNVTIIFPPGDANHKRVCVAHRDFAQAWKATHVLSIILPGRASTVGVMTCERRVAEPFDTDTILILETACALLGPVIELKAREKRWISGRIRDKLSTIARNWFGPRNPALRALAAIAGALLLFGLVVPLPFRVSADATVEGAVQRAAVAPFAGYVAEAPVRAGDIVKPGQVLAMLDDRDLRLDAMKWESERSKVLQEQRRSLAEEQRADMMQFGAQLAQADAQLALALAKLERAHILAPIAGVVISGDLSQRLGSPVEQGEVLYEIAPLQDYRVKLRVDEQDIRLIRENQGGRLLLAGMASDPFDMKIVRVTAVASADDGKNQFDVEATLTNPKTAVRPGMEGIGKIQVGYRPILFIWSRPMLNWLRLSLWDWMP